MCNQKSEFTTKTSIWNRSIHISRESYIHKSQKIPSDNHKVLYPCKLIIYSSSHWMYAFTHIGRCVLLRYELLLESTMNTSKLIQFSYTHMMWLLLSSHVLGLSRFFCVSAIILLLQFTQLYSKTHACFVHYTRHTRYNLHTCL